MQLRRPFLALTALAACASAATVSSSDSGLVPTLPPLDPILSSLTDIPLDPTLIPSLKIRDDTSSSVPDILSLPTELPTSGIVTLPSGIVKRRSLATPGVGLVTLSSLASPVPTDVPPNLCTDGILQCCTNATSIKDDEAIQELLKSYGINSADTVGSLVGVECSNTTTGISTRDGLFCTDTSQLLCCSGASFGDLALGCEPINYNIGEDY